MKEMKSGTEQQNDYSIAAKPIAIGITAGFTMLAGVLAAVQLYFAPIGSGDENDYKNQMLPPGAVSKLQLKQIQQQQRALLEAGNQQNQLNGADQLSIMQAMQKVVQIYDPGSVDNEGNRP